MQPTTSAKQLKHVAINTFRTNLIWQTLINSMKEL